MKFGINLDRPVREQRPDPLPDRKALAVDYDADRRIAGIEIMNNSITIDSV